MVDLWFRNDADYSRLLIVGPQLLILPAEMTAVANRVYTNSCSYLIKLPLAPQFGWKQCLHLSRESKQEKNVIVLYFVYYLIATYTVLSWKQKSQHPQKVIEKDCFCILV